MRCLFLSLLGSAWGRLFLSRDCPVIFHPILSLNRPPKFTPEPPPTLCTAFYPRSRRFLTICSLEFDDVRPFYPISKSATSYFKMCGGRTVRKNATYGCNAHAEAVIYAKPKANKRTEPDVALASPYRRTWGFLTIMGVSILFILDQSAMG